MELKRQVLIAQRQLTSDELHQSKAQAKNNPKYQAYAKQRDDLTKELHNLSSLVDTIFNSVYVHRSKDFYEVIRFTCICHLNDFILFDATHTIRVEYLKYLGWACYDHADSVRLQAVQSVISLIEVRIS